jgi:enamine deaminase RidA (YjgF/YER057c/UK114 family)
MTVTTRLQQLGVTLPPVAAPVAAYVPARRSGDLVHTSGQLPFVDGALPATGKVGEGAGLVSPEEAKRLARIAGLNALAAAADAAGGVDRIVRVVKVVGFVASDPSFTGQPGVVNGGERAARQGVRRRRSARAQRGRRGRPALDAPVEVEITVEVAA